VGRPIYLLTGIVNVSKFTPRTRIGMSSGRDLRVIAAGLFFKQPK